MKSVGKQLQEARLARNWTPELAARETKIKVARLLDLEGDDYTHFTSPAYARGFVRTYARSLGLDEYRILRQLDNKLPEDDTANIVTDTGVAYLPETALPPRAAHRNYAGLYVVMTLGFMVSLVIAFVLFEAYRVGELQRYFAQNPAPETVAADANAGTNTAPTNSGPDATARALPVDSNTPPPVVDATTNAVDTTPPASVRALPVDPTALANTTNSASSPDAPVQAVRALPVDPSELANPPPTVPAVQTPVAQAPAAQTPVAPAPQTASATATPVTQASPDSLASAPPRALPVDPNDLNAAPAASAPPAPPPSPAPSLSARAANAGPVMMPSLPAAAPPSTNSPAAATGDTVDATGNKRLVLTATQDSFVRVTDVDAPDAEKPLYAATLRSGQSVGFDGHKFSINVGVPSAVNIKLDGIDYGPHSDQDEPETFTVESHQP